MPHFQYYMRFMIFSQNLISILLSKPDKQADMQMSFFGADPLPKTPDHQKKFVAHQNSNFFILSYALVCRQETVEAPMLEDWPVDMDDDPVYR